MIFYFSATGNCLSVAKNIGAGLGTKTVSIPKAIHSNTKVYRDDVIGIVFPVYDGGAPRMVCDFLKQVELKADYIFAIATYGMASGNPFRYLDDAIGGRYKLDYANTLKMVDTFLDGFEMENQIRTLPKKDVEGHLKSIITDLEMRKTGRFQITLLGNLQTSLMKSMYKKSTRPDASDRFTIDDTCIKCGICSKVCPGGNIEVTDHTKFLNKSCQGCYACIHACPKHAIHLKAEKSDARYRNPQVKLQEIIEANHQR